MKKNLITVIILALCLINLVFNILLVFVFMPSAAKTNKLITDISAVLDLEINSKHEGEPGTVAVSDLAPFMLEQGTPVNLAGNGDSDVHAVQYGLTINLDSTAKDYKEVNENLTTSTAIIYDKVGDIIGQYTYDQVIKVETKKQIRDEILISLRQTFDTECIYSISFYNFIAQ